MSPRITHLNTGPNLQSGSCECPAIIYELSGIPWSSHSHGHSGSKTIHLLISLFLLYWPLHIPQSTRRRRLLPLPSQKIRIKPCVGSTLYWNSRKLYLEAVSIPSGILSKTLLKCSSGARHVSFGCLHPVLISHISQFSSPTSLPIAFLQFTTLLC